VLPRFFVGVVPRCSREEDEVKPRCFRFRENVRYLLKNGELDCEDPGHIEFGSCIVFRLTSRSFLWTTMEDCQGINYAPEEVNSIYLSRACVPVRVVVS
jgi:hypothetical protein